MNKQAKRLISIIIRDRQYLQTNKRFWPLIESYSNFERKILLFLNWSIIGFAFITIIVIPELHLTENSLPLNVELSFLPIENSSVGWWINYAYQFTLLMAALFIFNAYIGVTILVISHACFKVDTAMISVKRWGNSFKENTKNIKYWRIWNHSVIENRMKRVVDETNDIIEYTKMAQKLIAMPNFLDNLIVCFAICVTIYSILNDWKSSLASLVYFVLTFSQLALYNIAGQIIINKMNSLSFSVYDTPWYNLSYKKRKDIMSVLLATQNMNGLKGIFSNLCNATFYQVRPQRI